jgi:hypothetical protein
MQYTVGWNNKINQNKSLKSPIRDKNKKSFETMSHHESLGMVLTGEAKTTDA